jgi:hypothetical protein
MLARCLGVRFFPFMPREMASRWSGDNFLPLFP